MPTISIRIDARIGPKNIAVLTIMKNFPPSIASCARRERDSCFFVIHFRTLILTLAFANKKIANHDKGIVNNILIKVALTTPKSFTVTANEPSINIIPAIAIKTPEEKYTFFFKASMINLIIPQAPFLHTKLFFRLIY